METFLDVSLLMHWPTYSEHSHQKHVWSFSGFPESRHVKCSEPAASRPCGHDLCPDHFPSAFSGPFLSLLECGQALLHLLLWFFQEVLQDLNPTGSIFPHGALYAPAAGPSDLFLILLKRKLAPLSFFTQGGLSWTRMLPKMLPMASETNHQTFSIRAWTSWIISENWVYGLTW